MSINDPIWSNISLSILSLFICTFVYVYCYDFIMCLCSLRSLPSYKVIDFHKVEGLKGAYIASQINSQRQLESFITFDKGGVWQHLVPPSHHADGRPIRCEWVCFTTHVLIVCILILLKQVRTPCVVQDIKSIKMFFYKHICMFICTHRIHSDANTTCMHTCICMYLCRACNTSRLLAIFQPVCPVLAEQIWFGRPNLLFISNGETIDDLLQCSCF